MVAIREEEIRRFQPQPYYGIKANVTINSTDRSSLSMIWHEESSGNSRSFDQNKVECILAGLSGAIAAITDVEKSAKKTIPPLLYDLTELQRDANKKYGFSAKETLDIMQRLYENHKVLTYPRTDSRYLTTDIVDTLTERIESCSVGSYRKLAAGLTRKKLQTNLFFVDNTKVSDHHAIIPTEQFVQLDHMTNEERKVYDLVIRRFLSVFYPPFEYEQTTVKAKIGTETFISKGRVLKNQGWKAVYENDAADEDSDLMAIPEVKKGDLFSSVSTHKTVGKTAPPPPFNEAALLSAMENPVKFMESKKKEDIKILGDTGGLGTVATRADIIEKLFHNGLLEKRSKDIFLTAKAKQLLELVPEDIKKPELTADWEKKLSLIAKGSLKRNVFMCEIKSYTETLIQEIKIGDGKFHHDNLTKQKCPECGKYLLLVKGKNSTSKACQDRSCGYRETVSRTSNARCPKCHKKMELQGNGDSQIFLCGCGYKEKLTAFQERRKKEGAGVTKKDVNQYLNQQKKEEPLNNPFADAFSKLGL